MADPIDITPLQRALGMLDEALAFWQQQPDGTPLKPHLRSAVIQSFEFTDELAVRLMRRVLVERSPSASSIVDLSFNDLMRVAADARLLDDPARWRPWRELRNATSQADDEARAQQVALVDAFEAGPLPYRVDLVERDGRWPGMAERVLGEAVPL